MSQPTSIINPLLDKVGRAAALASSRGMPVSVNLAERYLTVVSIASGLAITVDLETDYTADKLTSAIARIQAVTPLITLNARSA